VPTQRSDEIRHQKRNERGRQKRQRDLCHELGCAAQIDASSQRR
jgi:hypothetical protein